MDADARPPAFASLLHQAHAARGLTQRAVATAAGIDVARYNRLLGGDVAPVSGEQVLRLAGALSLDARQTDRLVAAAGFLPPGYMWQADPPVVRRLREVLADSSLSAGSRETLVTYVEQTVAWFLAANGRPRAGSA